MEELDTTKKYLHTLYVMAGPSFYQRPIAKFKPSGAGKGSGVRRLQFAREPYTTIDNRYVVGAGVGALSTAVRRAVMRRASNGQNGKPCGFDCAPAPIEDMRVLVRTQNNSTSSGIRTYPQYQ